MTRTGYHHGNLREALVEAAVELAGAEGPGGVVLRAVTRRVGVSPNAAYRHFADRDALLREVAARAMRALVASMRRRQEQVRATEPVAAAVERLEAVGRGYVDFALAQPGMFRVCFSAPPEAPPEVTPEVTPAPLPDREDGPNPFGVLTAALDRLVEVGWIDPARRPGAEVLCWSVVHGFATLHVDGPLVGTPEAERQASLDAALAHVSRGLGPGGPPGNGPA